MSKLEKVRPINPTAPIAHGLFGVKYFKEHMFMSDKWEPSSLTTQYKFMVNVLGKKLDYQKHYRLSIKKRQKQASRNLRKETRDGRTKLKLAMQGNTRQLRSFLLDHKDMQRLYQRMPIHQVVENVNQRTFVLRKENDRLKHRRNQLTEKYEHKVMEKSKLEDRIQFQNEFVLDEEIKSKQVRKITENSLTRLRGIKTINRAYKKMIQALMHDSIYYEPVLNSLHSDLKEQENLIEQIVQLGLPVIGKLKELSEEYRRMTEKVRKSVHTTTQWLANFKQDVEARNDRIKKIVKKGNEFKVQPNRYARETDSMLQMKNELENIEKVIKNVKLVTLCSKATDIYPRMKQQVNNNARLKKELHQMMEEMRLRHEKDARAKCMKSLLMHDLSPEEIQRVTMIKELQNKISNEKTKQKKIDEQMRDASEVFCRLRYSLWNINEVLRFVSKPPKSKERNYPNDDIQLPLLKFDNLTMRAFPPDAQEENVDKLMDSALANVKTLLVAAKNDVSPEELEAFKNEYHDAFLANVEVYEESTEQQTTNIIDMQEEKLDAAVPTRKAIKSISAKMVEELTKKDE